MQVPWESTWVKKKASVDGQCDGCFAPGCSRDYGEGKGGDLKLLVHPAPWCLHREKGQDHTTAMKIKVHQQHSPQAIFFF